MGLFGIGSRSSAGPTLPPAPAPSSVPETLTLEPGDAQKRAQTAYAAAVLANLAYEDDAAVVRATLSRLGFEEVTLYGWDKRGSTQAIVARRGDVVIVSFRGTQERGDIAADIRATNPEEDPKLTGNEVQDYRRFAGARVHRGFRDALAEVWDPDPGGVNGERLAAAGQKSLLRTLQLEADRPNTRIIFTGHSLGGALATLAAAATSVQNPARSSRTTMQSAIAGVYTFGSPKVGNAAFAQAFDASLQAVTEPAQHHTDVVRSVPPGLGYQHVAQEQTVLLPPADASNPPSPTASHSMAYYLAAQALRAQAELNGPAPDKSGHRLDSFVPG